MLKKKGKKIKKTALSKEKVRGVVDEKRRAQVAAVATKLIENPSLPLGAVIREVGLSEYAATHPSTLTNTKEWGEMMDEYLPSIDVLSTHRGLLRASRLDHMTFMATAEGITDDDIHEMFAELNCKVRRIIHRDNGARDVYFWSPDNKARATALELVYKLRGSFAVDKAAVAFSLVALAKMRDAQDAPKLPPASDTPQLPRAV